MHKLKAILCALLSACIMAVPFASSMINAGAEEQTVEQKIAELDKKSAEYQAVLDRTGSDISKKEEYGETLLSEISVMNEKIILTRESIEKLNKNIKGKQGEIDKQNEEIDGQIEALCERLSLIYMAGSASNLEILLGAKDFGDFIDKVELVKTLSAYDKQMIDELNKKIDGIEADKKKMEDDKSKLEKTEANLQKEIGELNKLVESNKAALTELTAKSEQARAALDAAKSQTSELEAEHMAEIAAEQAAAQAQTLTPEQQEAAKKAAAEAQKQEARRRQQQEQQQQQQEQQQQGGETSGGSSSGGSSSGGSGGSSEVTPTPVSSGYTWPCPGFYYLTSLWNEDRTTYNHGAIDIGGGDIWGAAVVAADGGTVVDTCTYCTHNYPKAMTDNCGCGGGYGNYVKIDHGNGKVTIYAHLTTVAVSPGQTVSKGQVLGYVGTTGQSTGPHLHFECRLNGVRYNPMDELSAYWGMVSY